MENMEYMWRVSQDYDTMNPAALQGGYYVSVALYTRVSTDRQASDGYSLRAQEELLLRYCNDHGIKDYKIYRDEGCSAKQRYNKRPVMMQMLSDIESGLIHLVLFIKLDRWMRDVAEYHKVQEILDRNHCSWRAILEEYETETANGRMTVNIMLSVNQNEAERTSERIKLTNVSKIAHGEPITQQPFGYKIIQTPEGKRIGVDEEQYKDLRFVVDSFIATRSLYNVTKVFNDTHDVKHTTRWAGRIFDNIEQYSGEFRGNPNYRPRLLDDDTILLVKQIRKEGKSQRHRKNTFLFTGLIKCPCCGRNLSSHKSYVTAAGDARYYYLCQKSCIKCNCTFNLYMNESIVEQYLLSHIKEAVSDELDIRIQRKQESEKDYSKEKAKVKEKIRRLARMYEDEIISDEEYARRAAELKAQLKEIESLSSEGHKDPKELEELLHTDIIGAYNLMNREAKKVFWLNLLESIEISETEHEVVGFTLR